MKRLAFLAVLACLCSGALPGTGRAGTITYEVFSGGAHGTLLAEYVVQSLITETTSLANFTPTVLPSGLVTPGTLEGLLLPSGEAAIDFVSGNTSGVDANFFSAQLPTGPGTFTLDSDTSGVFNEQGRDIATPDTLVITSSSTTAAPEPASLTLLGLGAAGLLGYGRRRRRAAEGRTRGSLPETTATPLARPAAS
jgi:hypothetical protein